MSADLGIESAAEILAAERCDELRRVGAGFVLARRVINFDEATLGTNNLGLLY